MILEVLIAVAVGGCGDGSPDASRSTPTADKQAVEDFLSQANTFSKAQSWGSLTDLAFVSGGLETAQADAGTRRLLAAKLERMTPELVQWTAVANQGGAVPFPVDLLRVLSAARLAAVGQSGLARSLLEQPAANEQLTAQMARDFVSCVRGCQLMAKTTECSQDAIEVLQARLIAALRMSKLDSSDQRALGFGMGSNFFLPEPDKIATREERLDAIERYARFRDRVLQLLPRARISENPGEYLVPIPTSAGDADASVSGSGSD